MVEQPAVPIQPPEPAAPRRGRRAWLAVLVVGAAALVAALVYSPGGDDRTEPAEQTSASLSEGLRAHAEGRTQDAQRAYAAVLERDPANKYAHYNLGLLEQSVGRDEEAERRYRRALRADATFRPALFNLAILLTPRDPEDALSLYARIVRLSPDDAEAHLNMGLLLRQLGRIEEGDRALARAVELDPTLADRRVAGSPRP